ncbi:MAG: hypothetical protein HYY24_25425, partial [Verrucomicrobia bacterium]|nr:hypothetical protein [Verrucomicrobiota bacterium]
MPGPTGDAAKTVAANLAEGGNTVEAELDIGGPALWWPNGQGQQPLYELQAQLQMASGEILDSRKTQFGIRKIRWEGEAGSAGDRMKLLVNGRAVRQMGSDLLPPYMLFGRILQRGPRFMRLAKAAGMNTLRLWGGGVILLDEMYDLADELGIMLISEFPMANFRPQTNPENRMRTAIVVLAIFAVAMTCSTAGASVSLKTATAAFRVDEKGSLAAITGNSRNYLAPGQPSPLLQVRISGKWLPPESAAWDAKTGRLTLRYAGGATIAIKAAAKKSHVALEVLDAQPREAVELVWWGPYPTTIGDIIGEVVGVARDHKFAIGIQALNAKTLGGAPGSENDIGIDYATHDDPGRYADFPPELNKGSGYRGNTAWPTAFGSVLQAFCRNRSRDRVISNWGHERYLAPAFHDGGVVGSKIALFGCPAAQALATLGEIEVAEGLPHPMLDGVWGKIAPRANESYLIVDFGEHNVEQAIAMAQAAGLRYLYHSSPFETWGHFKLKSNLFPNGWDSLRTCVEKARQAGVRVGVH